MRLDGCTQPEMRPVARPLDREEEHSMVIQTFDLVSWGTGGQTRIQVRIDPDGIQGVRGMFGAALLINYDVTAIGPHADEAALLTIEGWLLWNNEQPVTPGIHIPS